MSTRTDCTDDGGIDSSPLGEQQLDIAVGGAATALPTPHSIPLTYRPGSADLNPPPEPDEVVSIRFA